MREIVAVLRASPVLTLRPLSCGRIPRSGDAQRTDSVIYKLSHPLLERSIAVEGLQLLMNGLLVDDSRTTPIHATHRTMLVDFSH